MKKQNNAKILILFLLAVLSNSIKASNPLLSKKAIIKEQMTIPISSDLNFPRIAYTQEQINFVLSKIESHEEPWYSAYNRLISIADSYANRVYTASIDFHTPAYYDNPDANIQAKDGLALDAYAAHSNALAYVLSGEIKYATKAIYFLNAWASINKTITENDANGQSTGTILTATNLMSQFLIAGDLLLGQSVWNDSDKDQFRYWVQNVILPNVTAIKTNANNWGDWGTFAVASSYHILGNDLKVADEIERVKARIDKYQNSDGSMPQETRREINGLWYTYFALTPITLSAQLAYNITGQDLFHWTSTNGKSIEKALDYLEYYELHKSEWPWYPMTNSAIDKDAPTDLFEAMNYYYDNKYNSYSNAFRPVFGGYKGTRVSHTGWDFPTLMRMSNKSSTEIIDSKYEKFNTYPNPTTGIFKIISDKKIYSISLYNLVGEEIENINLENTDMFDISSLTNGIYIAKIDENIVKIIKK